MYPFDIFAELRQNVCTRTNLEVLIRERERASMTTVLQNYTIRAEYFLALHEVEGLTNLMLKRSSTNEIILHSRRATNAVQSGSIHGNDHQSGVFALHSLP